MHLGLKGAAAPGEEKLAAPTSARRSLRQTDEFRQLPFSEIELRFRAFHGRSKAGLVGIDRIEYPMTLGSFVKVSLWCEQQASGSKPVAKARAVTIYGIKNCDTMKKARAWLDDHGVAYAFHDYKTQGIERARLEAWARDVGWETLLNRAGTTFRKLPDKDKDGLNEKKALALMLAQPSMIKRPVLDSGGKLLVGFTPETYRKVLG
jgi:arsenate reductase